MAIRSMPDPRRHYPVGVLFDLLAGQQLPWSITVHFQGFPTSQLMRCARCTDGEHTANAHTRPQLSER